MDTEVQRHTAHGVVDVVKKTDPSPERDLVTATGDTVPARHLNALHPEVSQSARRE